jgi:peroxiredoxin
MFGKDMPEFVLVDVSGNHISKQDLAGKVAVFNFWFIGCPPCEMERPALNILRHKYDDREDVVFLSIARDSLEAVNGFVKDQPIDYDLYPSSKAYIKDTFKINGYPVNIVVDKKGKYFYYGLGSGTGVIDILQKQIDAAVAAK